MTKLELVPLPTRPQLQAAAGVSKSMAKALGCPTFFTGQYLQPDSVSRSQHFLTISGIEFHEWRKAYLQHLQETSQPVDRDFAAVYLAAHHISDDARILIERDGFAVDPDTIAACELFLSVDREFRPLEQISDREPGKYSDHPDALLWGTLDLLLIDGSSAWLRDPKSGFSTTAVTDDEPIIYATLVFSHFPFIETVHWAWDFVRSGTERQTAYSRKEDYGWMKTHILGIVAQKKQVIAGYNAGSPLQANPFAGLCPYCDLHCPLRPRWDSQDLAIGPPQTRDDAIRLAQIRKVSDDIVCRIDDLLKAWLDQEPEQRLVLGAGWEAALKVYGTADHPLPEALAKLGLALVPLVDGLVSPAKTPLYDVPLASLTLGNLSSFMKAKKRVGMKEDLLLIAKRGAATKLVIRKPSSDDEDLTPILLASLAAHESPA